MKNLSSRYRESIQLNKTKSDLLQNFLFNLVLWPLKIDIIKPVAVFEN